PLFSAFFTINYALFGTQAWGWHLANVLVHAGVAVLVYFAVKEITDRAPLAILTAALFAVHPVHAESVAWTSGITDPLMALFLLPAFSFYVRARRTGRAGFMLLASVLYLLSLLSKETALALPVVIAGCELFYWKAGRAKERIDAMSRLALLGAPTLV